MRAVLRSLFGSLEREAWLRFLAAIGGLTLAFAFALFSTTARETGNLLATALLASMALLLAGAVGVATVPYLARRVAVRRVRDAFDYELTREGLVYLGAVLVIGIAALNTGNNLLFIVVAALLAAVLVSGIASAIVLRSLALDVSIPVHVFAGTKALARVTLQNTRRRLPSFSVSIVPSNQIPKKAWVWQRSHFGIPISRPPERQWLRIPDLSLSRAEVRSAGPPIFEHSVYFPYVRAKSAAFADIELNFPRRGRYLQEGIGIATRFPFAFLEKTRRTRLNRELVVYPSISPTEEFFEILPMITGEFEAFASGRGHDLYRIREYMPEDSARHVDWKASARSMSLKVREFTREDERKLRLVFDNPAPGVTGRDAYERGIELAASLAWHFTVEDTELTFAAQGYTATNDVYDFLRYLALAEPAESDSLLDHLEVTDDYNIILTSRTRGSIPTALWACSYFLFFG